MPTLEFVCEVPAPLQAVWELHDDPAKGLPALSPPDSEVQIENADLPVREGSRIVISFKGLLGRRMRWTARIVEHRPPHAVVFGEEARFVDEQEHGPFKTWRHEHDFERVDEKTTRITDRVTYRLHLGPIGWIVEMLFIRPQIKRMFRHRHQATRAYFDVDAPLATSPSQV